MLPEFFNAGVRMRRGSLVLSGGRSPTHPLVRLGPQPEAKGVRGSGVGPAEDIFHQRVTDLLELPSPPDSSGVPSPL